MLKAETLEILTGVIPRKHLDLADDIGLLLKHPSYDEICTNALHEQKRLYSLMGQGIREGLHIALDLQEFFDGSFLNLLFFSAWVLFDLA